MSEKNLKVLLTGAAGHLGRAVREMARTEFPQVEIVPLDITTGGDETIIAGTFTDAALVDELMQDCDGVIHTAALHGGNRKTHTPTQYTEVNVGGFVTLMEACLKHGAKRFVFSSTMEVVIGADWAASGMAVVDERAAPNPDWIYPANKWACENIGSYYHVQHGIEFVALRYMAFGDEVQGLSPHFLARYLTTDDVARANLLALTKPDLSYEILHIGPRQHLTQQDLVQAARDPFAVIEKHYPGSAQLLRENGVALSLEHFWPVTRIDRARQILGWEPRVNFEQYLQSLGWKEAAGKAS